VEQACRTLCEAGEDRALLPRSQNTEKRVTDDEYGKKPSHHRGCKYPAFKSQTCVAHKGYGAEMQGAEKCTCRSKVIQQQSEFIKRGKKMTHLLEQAVNAARNLPKAMQDDLAQMMMMFTASGHALAPLTDEENDALDRSEASANKGIFASEAEVEAVWAKPRRKAETL
jgi:hypothetical protein